MLQTVPPTTSAFRWSASCLIKFDSIAAWWTSRLRYRGREAWEVIRWASPNVSNWGRPARPKICCTSRIDKSINPAKSETRGGLGA